MDYKTILVHAQADAAALPRITAAMSLARRFHATVLGVAAETWYPTAPIPEFGFIPAEMMDTLQKDCEGRTAAAVARFRELADVEACEALCSAEVARPLDALLARAAAADLIVASRPHRDDSDAQVARAAELIMASGLPVLLVANPTRAVEAKRVVVGWKDTRESRRALADSLPFLRRAEAVHLVQVANDQDLAEVEAGLEVVAARLARHGITEVKTVAVAERAPICETLDAYAARSGADLVVMGAYGHSRLRETVFGGVTEDFLNGAAAHVLFSR